MPDLTAAEGGTQGSMRRASSPVLPAMKGASTAGDKQSVRTRILEASPGQAQMEPANSDQVSTVEEYVKKMGGKRAISRILIANNGIAAVKAIRSIRKFAYETFGNDRIFEFVAMATPEDMKANAQYIHLADEFISVPGGSNNNNYANVMLITELAERCGAHAVWAGWGHASENPKLPEALARTSTGVVWIGPGAEAMRALGDKIGSTLIAQSAGVSCMPWSGSGLTVDYAKTGIPDSIYEEATARNVEQAEAMALKIGFPIMIKASEGGGGKGIRKCHKQEEVSHAFRQVQGEVPGSPVFLMKLAPVCRHLEVQLLADEWGDAIAIFGRDCSIQRRHQKIIEEGPVVAAPTDVWRTMEKAAVRLAREVGYVGAGTVEYLYTEDGNYCFLELNPRLQVEHPVTELISGVNLPAAQLQVAMGIPLHRIRGVRGMYGLSPDGSSAIDFDNAEPKTLPGHVIACRITAENPDMEFQPTSGVIQELNFRSTPNVWGYFSVAAMGGVHEYSDSQFGHMFALGDTREQARRNMVQALKELSIRGDIRTTVEYLRQILETDDYRRNLINTTWLEQVMAQHKVAIEKPETCDAVLMGAVFRAQTQSNVKEEQYMGVLERGQLPSPQLYGELIQSNIELIYDGVKYEIKASKSGPNSIDLAMEGGWAVSVDVHSLPDNGLLVLMDGKKHVVYGQDFPSGLRLIVDGKTCLFRQEYDPSELRSTVQGKLVRFLVSDGDHVHKDQPFAEVEVMKMYITVHAPEAGVISLLLPDGCILDAGDLMGRLQLDHPERVQKAQRFDSTFRDMGPATHNSGTGKPNTLMQSALKKLGMLLSGYQLGPGCVDRALDELMRALRDPSLPLHQFKEVVSTLAGRIPEPLFDSFQDTATAYADSMANNRFYWENPDSFPVLDVQDAIDNTVLGMGEAEAATLNAALETGGVTALLEGYKEGNHTHACQTLCRLLDEYFQVEKLFDEAHDQLPETVVKQLRKRHKNDAPEVARLARAHHQLAQRSALVVNILAIVESQLAPLIDRFLPMLRRLSALQATAYADVVRTARHLIVRHDLPSSEQRRIAIKTILGTVQSHSSPAERMARLAPLVNQAQPLEDMIFDFVHDNKAADVASAALEVYIRRAYHSYSILDLDITNEARSGVLVGRWSFVDQDSNEGVVAASMPKIDSAANLAQLVQEAGAAAACRQGAMVCFRSFEAAKKNFASALEQIPAQGNTFAEPVHVLYVSFRWGARVSKDELLSQYLLTTAKAHESAMVARGIRRVTFVVTHGKEEYPSYFTFRARTSFSEDTLIRHIEPCYALHMALGRLSKFDIVFVPTDTRAVHLFAAFPKSGDDDGAAAQQLEQIKPPSRVYDGRRFFVRVLVRKLDSAQLYKRASERSLDAHPEAEFAFVEALNALELAIGGQYLQWRHNSIFMNLLIDADIKPEYVSKVVRLLATRYSDKIRRLNVEQVEVQVSFKDGPDSPRGSMNSNSSNNNSKTLQYRFVCTNPTGYVLVVDPYVEQRDNSSGVRTLKWVGEGKVAGAWDGCNASAPYPVSFPFQKQREAAARTDTAYVYDFLPILDKALRVLWFRSAHPEREAKRGRSRLNSLSMPGESSSSASASGAVPVGPSGGDDNVSVVVDMPEKVLEVTELVLDPEGRGLKEVKREPGQNDIGMVAWKLNLKTPQYPNGREVVIIANDISHQAGTFGPKEDELFGEASKLARALGIPRLYFAANSGARIGLAEEVKAKFQIAWCEDNVMKGVEYLYLSEKDYAALKDCVICEKVVTPEGETRFKLQDIVGRKDGLGVENLSGSGMIAGETSLAYEEIFTLTYVTGRTVGIGAYLARLGQRCIQKQTPPILLTGFNALNKLLGRPVYSSNVQLGGPDIMYTNGVTHITVGNDLEGVLACLNWLSYVPARRLASLPAPKPSLLADPIDRLVTFKPTKGLPYDPRHLLQGCVDEQSGVQLQGFFDQGSFTEVLGGWAKSVVAGRARLGGVSMGVVTVETRTIEQVIPADPASPESQETVVQRAGQVWYPDSAFKTSQAIRDMIAEDLPLMILANWRGFSGGMQDMFDEVLKYGSYIVDSLREYKQPVFVYIPPYGTLRGGAWVVVDSTINEDHMEMFADVDARGGVLESEGTVDVKYRQKDLVRTAHRLDGALQALDKELEAVRGSDNEAANGVVDAGESKEPEGGVRGELEILADIKAREKALLPLYHSAATAFTDLHDTPGRMKAKGVIDRTVRWEESRTFFYWRLRLRLLQNELVKEIRKGEEHQMSVADAKKLLSQFAQECGVSKLQCNDQTDKDLVLWYQSHAEDLQNKLNEWRGERGAQTLVQLMKANPQGLAAALQSLAEADAKGLGEAIRALSAEAKASAGL